MANFRNQLKEPMQLRRFYSIAFLGILSVSTAFAQQSILWEISGNDLKAPSYLMGTLKFIGEKEFFIPPQVEERIKKVQIFAIEDQVDHHAQHELNEVLHFPKGQSLKSVLSEQDYERLLSFFDAEFGVSSGKFEKTYARMVPLALSIAMTRLSLGENVKFFDIELLKLAKKYNLETYSLEPITREAQALKSYTIEDQVKALLHSVDNFDQQKSEFNALVAEYFHGDLEKIFAYTVHPMEGNTQFIEEFYYKRNAEWLPVIDKMVHDRPSFIAVGIAHLEGERGMLALLKEKGYILTPVPVSR